MNEPRRARYNQHACEIESLTLYPQLTKKSVEADQIKTNHTGVNSSEVNQVGFRQIGLWATIVSCIFAAAPATYPGYWQGMEGFVPVFNAAKSHAIAAVATMPDFWRGVGSATFLITQPLVALGLQPTTAVRITFIFAIVLGGIGLYAWLLPKLGDQAAGLAASIYTLFPPFLSTIYERGSPSDALIMGLFPVALMGASAHKRTRSMSGLGVLLICVLWMWRVQAGMAAFATILLLFYIGTIERDWRGTLVAAISGGIGLATWFLFGTITATPAAPFAEHFVQFYQLLLNRLQPTTSEQLQQFAFQPYTIQLGFVALGVGILTLWYWRFGLAPKPLTDRSDIQKRDLNRSLWFSLLVGALLVCLSLEVSNPLWQATGADRLLTYPFQIVLLSAPFLAMLAGALLVVNRSFAQTPYWLVLIVMTLLNGAPYLLPNYTQVAPLSRPVAVVGSSYNTIILETELNEDFTQQSDDQSASPEMAFPAILSNPPETVLTVTWQTLNTPDFDYNIFFQVLVPDGDGHTLHTQIDVQPLGGERPMTTWRPGEILTERYRLDLSDLPERADGQSAKLRYDFGYYDWREGNVRQPILIGSSKSVDDKLIFYGE